MNQKQEVYFDNAAATRLDEEVLAAMEPFFFSTYAVATSEFAYSQGIEAREALEMARGKICSLLKVSAEEFIFTSGDTESSNLALKGVARALDKKGRHLIVSKIEDFPVLYSARTLEREGFSVTYLDVDGEGFVDQEQLKKSITKETILVSIQHANQEIGTIQDIESIARICHDQKVLLHSDATHSFMRSSLDLQATPIDLLTVSAHTIHGPKGIGGLFIRKGTPILKILDGGFQEFDLRAGLENIPGAVGFAKAAELIKPEENERLTRIRNHAIDRILKEIPDTTLNGSRNKRLPQNVNISFHFVEGESITLHLDMRGFAVSTGSACFSKSLQGSHVIYGIGGDHERAHGSIRLSLGRYNTIEEVDAVVVALSEVVGELRKISPLGK